MKTTIEIQGRKIGPGHPTFVIAEMSANHQQDFEQACRIIREAKAAGADAIKLQTYTADTLTIDSRETYFRIKSGTVWDGKTLHELYREAYTPWEWQPKLKKIAEAEGLIFFSTPFDQSAITFLETLNVPAHKVASFEINDLRLIQSIARTGKPLIVSTGMATLSEIDEAVAAIAQTGNENVALLKCTSAYPAPPEEMNLRAIQAFSERYGTPVGLSDHSLGIAAPVIAVALGANLIEKHFTLSRSIPGPDNSFSLEPREFKEMVQAIRMAEKALGQKNYLPGTQESKSRAFRRSLFVVENVKAGDIFTERNVRSIRPSDGMAPKYLPDVLGKRASRDVKRGTPLQWDLVEKTVDLK